MAVSYKKLWKKFIDKKMKKTKFKEVIGINAGILAKSSKNKSIIMKKLIKMFEVLEYDLSNIGETNIKMIWSFKIDTC